jgi:Mrp family chromosome partitioning ATPase
MSIAHTSGALTGMPGLVNEVAAPIATEKTCDTVIRETDKLGRDELERLVQRVFLSKNGDTPHSVVFCGVNDPNSSAMVCARAAETLAAKTFRRICIVEADTKNNGVYRLLGVEASDVDHTVDNQVRQRCPQVRSNLWVASASALSYREGSTPDAEMVTKRLLAVRGEFDYIFINAASAGSRCDAALLGRAADGVILVLEASSTHRKVAQAVADTMRAAEVVLLGAVLNNRTYPIPEALYHRL